MPAFFKDLSVRRRSKASTKTPSDSTTTSSGNTSSNDGANYSDFIRQNKSSTTVNSDPDKQSPPATLSRSSTYLPVPNGYKTPPMSGMNGSTTRLASSQKRYSLVSMPSQNGETTPRQVPPTSPLSPRVTTVSDGSWVHQKVLLIAGECADIARPLDGTLTVCHHQDGFPPTQWPVNDSFFKALVHLQPGPNRLRFDFTSPKLLNPSGQPQVHSSWMSINCLPLIHTPPLQLCILLAKDSPETFDAPPDRIEREGNGLAVAIRKFRMMAYLWQAFTAEQMQRNNFGRRCYRYEEVWQPGTLSWKDLQSGQLRNEAKIHVIRMNKTVEEIRDLNLAQQYEPATKKGDLFSFAMDAVRGHFGASPEQRLYVSCMYLDTRWDKDVGTVRGHAALGGGDDSIKLAIFGSHSLHSYPSHIEEVVPAFTDCTRTDTNYVANDCNESGSSWEAANIGIGAHMHETGHLFGCPHQENGVMMRDYTRLNRTFTTREPYSTRTKQQGQRLCLAQDECGWHRLDTLRFRYHPCFQSTTDPAIPSETGIQVWTVDGSVLVTAVSGVAWIELFPEGDGECHHWIEYIDQSNPAMGCPKQVTLTEQMLRDRLPEDKRKKPLSLKVFSCGGGEHEVKSFSQLSSKEGRLKLPDGRPGFKSSKLGSSQMEGSQPVEVIFGICQRASKLMRGVKVYHGNGIDGIEFFYEDGDSALFGKRGGQPGDFALDIRRSETIIGFYVRAGYWIDGVQILTSAGRRSDMFGNSKGGNGYTLIPPRGYSIAGLHGTCGPWLDGFGLIITR